MNAARETVPLQRLLSKNSEVFKAELGTVCPFQAKLQICPGARPKFFKPRAVPFAIKPAIDRKLQRLESTGIKTKVAHSDWVAPIVPVPKKNGTLRICDYYKVTLNQALDVDRYPYLNQKIFLQS